MARRMPVSHLRLGKLRRDGQGKKLPPMSPVRNLSPGSAASPRSFASDTGSSVMSSGPLHSQRSAAQQQRRHPRLNPLPKPATTSSSPTPALRASQSARMLSVGDGGVASSHVSGASTGRLRRGRRSKRYDHVTSRFAQPTQSRLAATLPDGLAPATEGAKKKRKPWGENHRMDPGLLIRRPPLVLRRLHKVESRYADTFYNARYTRRKQYTHKVKRLGRLAGMVQLNDTAGPGSYHKPEDWGSRGGVTMAAKLHSGGPLFVLEAEKLSKETPAPGVYKVKSKYDLAKNPFAATISDVVVQRGVANAFEQFKTTPRRVAQVASAATIQPLSSFSTHTARSFSTEPRW